MEDKALSFGETLVGKTFNSSQNPKVDRAKEICAELADIVKELSNNIPTDDLNKKTVFLLLYSHTLGEILNAQMNVVKLLTFK